MFPLAEDPPNVSKASEGISQWAEKTSHKLFMSYSTSLTHPDFHPESFKVAKGAGGRSMDARQWVKGMPCRV